MTSAGLTFTDPPRVTCDFVDGVVVIDLITLAECGRAAVRLGYPLLLPALADVQVPVALASKMDVEVRDAIQGVTVVTTIDTGKLTWRFGASRTVQVGYTGVPHRAVKFTDQPVQHDPATGVTVARVPVDTDGGGVDVFFAELPLQLLDGFDLYKLWQWAAGLTRAHQPNYAAAIVTVPAQQLTYDRLMNEIVDANPGVVETCIQTCRAALDETGVRVKVATAMRLTRSVPPSFALGAHGPVVWWLAADDTPLAVTATRAEAWPDPQQTIDFNFD